MSQHGQVLRATRPQIDEFLTHKRLAVAGVSRNSREFSWTIVREFEARGYEAVLVTPATVEIEGRRCFASVRDVTPPIKAALLLTPPAATEQVVRDCHAAGVTHVWMHQAAGVGATNPAAIAFCRENGINLITGECPLMFLPGAAFPHRLHGFVRRITGSYPK